MTANEQACTYPGDPFASLVEKRNLWWRPELGARPKEMLAEKRNISDLAEQMDADYEKQNAG